MFYQPSPFYTGQNIQILSNEHLNKYNSLFIITLLKLVLEKFNWGGNGATISRLTDSRILLPVDEEGNPNYEYMEQFMKEKEKKLLDIYLNYLKSKIKKGDMGEFDLTVKKWHSFYLDELGNISSGKDIYEKERVLGDIPYITAKSQDNGIGYFIGNKNKTLEDNVISINRNGAVGYSYFHPYTALFSNDCRKFKLNEFSDNVYVSLFIVNQIKLQKDRYSYGYKLGTERLKKQKIMLPINDLNEPDFEFMENYMRKVEYTLLKKYSRFCKIIKKRKDEKK